MKKQFIAALLLGSTTLFAQDPALPQTETIKYDGKVFTVVEEMPQFPGGDKALEKFITDNIQYPADLKEIKGRKVVYVTFVVDLDGSITELRILKGITQSASDEVMRVMKLMPKWTPGKQNGKTVRVQYNLPVNFADR